MERSTPISFPGTIPAGRTIHPGSCNQNLPLTLFPRGPTHIKNIYRRFQWLLKQSEKSVGVNTDVLNHDDSTVSVPQRLSSYLITTCLLLLTLSIPSQAQETNISGNGLGTVADPLVNNQVKIYGGTRPGGGTTLYHSFSDFSIGPGDTAMFQHDAAGSAAPATSNILGRITGGNVSNIFGTIDTATNFPSAALFLMNTAGFIFGPNATLNVGSAFTAVTANKIQTADGTDFDASSATDNLVEANVAAFGFLNQPPPVIAMGSNAAIEIRGLNTQGSSVTFVGRDAVAGAGGPVVGGVEINGTLTTAGGNVEIASVDSPGRAILGSINLDEFSKQGQVTIGENATIGTQGTVPSGKDNGGDVVIQAGRFVMEANSRIDTSPRQGIPSLPPGGPPGGGPPGGPPGGGLPPPSFGKGGDVRLTATESASFFTKSVVDTSSVFALGGSGSVWVNAPKITAVGTTIGTSTTGAGAGGVGGSVHVFAEESFSFTDGEILTTSNNNPVDAGNVTITTQSADLQRGTISAGAGSTADSGSVELNVGTVTLSEFEITSEKSGGTGKAGKITIQGKDVNNPIADSVVIKNDSVLRTNSSSVADEGGGAIEVLTRILALLAGGGMESSNITSFQGGTAGKVRATATESVSISGTSSTTGDSSRILATKSGLGAGDAGVVEINTRKFTVTKEGKVTTTNDGNGQGGTITIQGAEGKGSSADMIVIDGTNTGLFSETNGTGGGGNIVLSGNEVIVRNNGTISASSSSTNPGAGSAGTVSIETSGSITVDQAKVASQAVQGDGGSVNLIAGQDVNVTNQSTLTTKSDEGVGGDITIGAGGSVSVTNSEVTAEAVQGDGGSVNLIAGQDVNVTNQSTLITKSDEGVGGDITIGAGGSVSVTNSEVTAKSTNNNAGSINIGTQANPIGHSIRIRDSSVITEVKNKTSDGGGGNINFFANNLIFIDPSLISSSVGKGKGGDITLKSPYIVIQLSQILAQAQGGQGGAITLDSNVALLDPFSQNHISASGGAGGVPGAVDIRAPIQNLKGLIAQLPQQIVNPANLFAQRCAAQKGGQFSSFVQGGRDGSPPGPGGFLASPLLMENFVKVGPVGRESIPPMVSVRRLGLLKLNDELDLSGNQQIAFNHVFQGCS